MFTSPSSAWGTPPFTRLSRLLWLQCTYFFSYLNCYFDSLIVPHHKTFEENDFFGLVCCLKIAQEPLWLTVPKAPSEFFLRKFRKWWPAETWSLKNTCCPFSTGPPPSPPRRQSSKGALTMSSFNNQCQVLVTDIMFHPMRCISSCSTFSPSVTLPWAHSPIDILLSSCGAVISVKPDQWEVKMT